MVWTEEVEAAWRAPLEWWELCFEGEVFATWDDMVRELGPEYMGYMLAQRGFDLTGTP